MANDLRGPLPVKVDPTSRMASFARCYWPSPWRALMPKPNGGIRAHARRVGLDRRAFLQSLCGAATTLFTFNEAFAALGNIGGQFRVPQEGAFEPAAAAETITGDGDSGAASAGGA